VQCQCGELHLAHLFLGAAEQQAGLGRAGSCEIMTVLLYRIQDTGYRIQDTGYRTQDTGYRIQDTGHRTQDTGHRIQDTGYRTQDTGYRILTGRGISCERGTNRRGGQILGENSGGPTPDMDPADFSQ
jgi:hypothetical protein